MAAAIGFVALLRRDTVIAAHRAGGGAGRGGSPAATPPGRCSRRWRRSTPPGRPTSSARRVTCSPAAGRAGVTVVISDLLNEGWDVAIDRLVAGGGDTSVLHVLADGRAATLTSAATSRWSMSRPVRRCRRACRRPSCREYAEHVEAWLAETSAHCVRNGATYVRVMADDAPEDVLLRGWREQGLAPMTFANPAGLALLALGDPGHPHAHPAAATACRSRCRRRCSGGKLERPVAAAKPWQRLRWSLLLLAQLLAVTGARARGRQAGTGRGVAARRSTRSSSSTRRRRWPPPTGRPTGSPTRVDRAVELRDELPGGGMASIVIAGDTPRVTLTASTDSAEFERALRTIDQSAGHPDFADAFALAESLDTGSTPIGYVFLTDGGLADTEERLLPPAHGWSRSAATTPTGRSRVSSSTAGAPGSTRGCRSATPVARRSPRRCASTSTASPPATQDVSLGRGESADVEFDLPEGDLVEAFLEGGDLLVGGRPRVRRRQAGERRAGAARRRHAVLGAAARVDPRRHRRDRASPRTGGPAPTVTTWRSTAASTSRTIRARRSSPSPRPAVCASRPATTTRRPRPAGDHVDGEVERPAVTLVRTDDPLLARHRPQRGRDRVRPTGRGRRGRGPGRRRGRAAARPRPVRRRALRVLHVRPARLEPGRPARVPAARRAARRPAQRHRVGRPRAHRRRPAARAAARRRDGHGHRRRRTADRDRAGRPGAAGAAPGVRLDQRARPTRRRRGGQPAAATRASWRHADLTAPEASQRV